MFRKLRGGGKRDATGALDQFYQVDSPDPATPLAELPLLAVDVETTGLDPKKDQILSIGWVPIDGNVIDLSGTGYQIIRQRSDASVGDSATIHQLTDDELAAGIDIKEALTVFLQAQQGRAMLVHFSAIEKKFLSAACKECFGAFFDVPIVDTFALERAHMEKMSTYPRGEYLRLARVRDRYGLPRYRSHRASTDALACAELYLAMQAQRPANTLKDVME